MKAVDLSSIVRFCLSFVFLVALFPLAAYPGMGIGGDSNGTFPDEAACLSETAPVIRPGPLSSPMRIAAGPGGDYLVVDYRRGHVYGLTPEAPENPLILFETEGLPLSVAWFEQEGKTAYLVGNDTDRTIDLYVVKKGSVHLGKRWFTHSGVQALDMAVTRSMQRIYVVDGGSGEVRVLDYSGRRIAFPDAFAGLVTPKGIAVDESMGEVIVSDYGDPAGTDGASVNVFDLDGNRLKTFTGGFSRPQGVTACGGRVFVVDAMLGQVLEFHPQAAAPVATYGCYGTSPGHLLLPMDVVYDGLHDALYVADSRNGRITVLPLTHETEGAWP